ncbi:uncharacterized protein LOC123505297 isoform X2 [Portunus trituberculatus]|nr:uncharacterized protein LOC123505297 isoform X2 [Portunus trituberculatus]XP_045112424.1 uncharacterized protein LOC123505297 isoform X2 [Portunus trituberculatus]XP_045112436.1 uncharacterized protein LOC123505297 isoform X2 [Portunus trituberculatus]
MSSNGSTRQFFSGTPPRRKNAVVPPEIHLYPSLQRPIESSRYEPNFMLGYGSYGAYGSLQYPKYPIATPHRNRDIGGDSDGYNKKSKGKLLHSGLLYPGTPEPPPGFSYGVTAMGKEAGVPGGVGKEAYPWHIPRASLWCLHKGYNGDFCKDCQFKHQERGIDTGSDIDFGDKGGLGGVVGAAGGGGGDGASTCSSINPPPTFTALDNYRPIRPRRPLCRHCSCGIIFAITTVFSILVLVLIAAFIIYVEMVLKHQQNAPMDRM